MAENDKILSEQKSNWTFRDIVPFIGYFLVFVAGFLWWCHVAGGFLKLVLFVGGVIGAILLFLFVCIKLGPILQNKRESLLGRFLIGTMMILFVIGMLYVMVGDMQNFLGFLCSFLDLPFCE